MSRSSSLRSTETIIYTRPVASLPQMLIPWVIIVPKTSPSPAQRRPVHNADLIGQPFSLDVATPRPAHCQEARHRKLQLDWARAKP